VSVNYMQTTLGNMSYWDIMWAATRPWNPSHGEGASHCCHFLEYLFTRV